MSSYDQSQSTSNQAQPWNFTPFPQTDEHHNQNDINDTPQLQMAFSQNSQQNHPPTLATGMFLAPMPQNGTNSFPSPIATLPATTPTHGQNGAGRSPQTNGWNVNPYASFPAIREDTQLGQVNSFHAHNGVTDTGNNMAFPWSIPPTTIPTSTIPPTSTLPIITTTNPNSTTTTPSQQQGTNQTPNQSASTTNNQNSSPLTSSITTPNTHLSTNNQFTTYPFPIQSTPNQTTNTSSPQQQSRQYPPGAPSTPTSTTHSAHHSPSQQFPTSNTPYDTTSNPWGTTYNRYPQQSTTQPPTTTTTSATTTTDNYDGLPPLRYQPSGNLSTTPSGQFEQFVQPNSILPQSNDTTNNNGKNNTNGTNQPQQSIAGVPIMNNTNNTNTTTNERDTHNPISLYPSNPDPGHSNGSFQSQQQNQSSNQTNQQQSPFPGLHHNDYHHYPPHHHHHHHPSQHPNGHTPTLSPSHSGHGNMYGYNHMMPPHPAHMHPNLMPPPSSMHNQPPHHHHHHHGNNNNQNYQHGGNNNNSGNNMYQQGNNNQQYPSQYNNNQSSNGPNAPNSQSQPSSTMNQSQQQQQQQQYPPTLTLHEIIAHHYLPSMCASQIGARSLQAELDYTAKTLKQPHLIQTVFHHLLPFILRLSVHPFANYVVQKLIDNLPTTNQTILIGNQTLGLQSTNYLPPSPTSTNPSSPTSSSQTKTHTSFEALIPPPPLYTPLHDWNDELQELYNQEQLQSISISTPSRFDGYYNNPNSNHPNHHHHHHHHNNNNPNNPNMINSNTNQPWSGLSMNFKPPPLPCEPEISPQYYCLLMLRAFNFGQGLFSLCIDPFGCRVVQKILDVFAHAQQQYNLNNDNNQQGNKKLTPTKMNKSSTPSLLNNASSATIKVDLHPILKEGYGLIYHHIAPHFYTFSVHQHANHVIQKCIETVPGFLNHPIFIPLFYPKIHQYRLVQKFNDFLKEETCQQYQFLTNGTLPALPLLSTTTSPTTITKDDSELGTKKLNQNNTPLKNTKKGSKKDDGMSQQHACCAQKGGIYNYSQDNDIVANFTPPVFPLNENDTTDVSSTNDTNEHYSNASYAIFYNTKLIYDCIDPLLNSTFTSYATTPESHRDQLERLTRMMGQQQRQLLQQQRERERLYIQQQQQQEKQLQLQQLQQLQQQGTTILPNDLSTQLMAPTTLPPQQGLDRFNNDIQNDLWYYLGQIVQLSHEKKMASGQTNNTEQYDIDEDEDDEDDDDDIEDEYDFTILPTNALELVKYKKNLLHILQERDDLFYSQFPYVYSSTSNPLQNKKILFHQLFATNLHDGYHLSSFTSLSTHTYGCRVIQRIYSYCNDSKQRELLLQQITESFVPLVQDLFGNYVIQHILTCGSLYDIQHITSLLRGNILSFAMNKCSSNVVEKALQCGNAMVVEGIIQELLTPIPQPGSKKQQQQPLLSLSPSNVQDQNSNQAFYMSIPLVLMISHPFANYVVQTILSVCLHEQKNHLISLIKRVSGYIELNEFSKKILIRVDPRFGSNNTNPPPTNNQSHNQQQMTTRDNRDNQRHDHNNNNVHREQRDHHNDRQYNHNNNNNNNRDNRDNRHHNNNNDNRRDNNDGNNYRNDRPRDNNNNNNNRQYNNNNNNQDNYQQRRDYRNDQQPRQQHNDQQPRQQQHHHHHQQQHQPQHHQHQNRDNRDNNQNQNNRYNNNNNDNSMNRHNNNNNNDRHHNPRNNDRQYNNNNNNNNRQYNNNNNNNNNNFVRHNRTSSQQVNEHDDENYDNQQRQSYSQQKPMNQNQQQDNNDFGYNNNNNNNRHHNNRNNNNMNNNNHNNSGNRRNMNNNQHKQHQSQQQQHNRS